MKRKILFYWLPSLVTAVVLVTITLTTWAKETAQTETLRAKDFSLEDILSGKKIRLSDYKNRYVFLLFGSLYCTKCAATIKNLNKLYEKHKSSGLMVVGIFMESHAGVREIKIYSAEKKLSIPVTVGNKEVFTDYNIKYVPEVFLINRNSMIIKKYTGEQSYNTFETDFLRLK